MLQNPFFENEQDTSAMKKRIIACDDATCITRSISMKLTKGGYDVQTAINGRDALELIRKSVPDLLISDCQMPYMDGLELIQALREEPATQDLPVIMLTAKGFELDHEFLQSKLKITQVVSKPFSPRELLKLVDSILAKQTETAVG
jgi:two-component system, OmpR family, alkaline phosphatase synthesis response regulator PhoP